MLSVIYLFLVFLSCIFGLLSENSAAVGAAALSGAQDGVRLTVAISGAICIWSALQKTMEASGLTNFVSMDASGAALPQTIWSALRLSLGHALSPRVLPGLRAGACGIPDGE